MNALFNRDWSVKARLELSTVPVCCASNDRLAMYAAAQPQLSWFLSKGAWLRVTRWSLDNGSVVVPNEAIHPDLASSR